MREFLEKHDWCHQDSRLDGHSETNAGLSPGEGIVLAGATHLTISMISARS